MFSLFFIIFLLLSSCNGDKKSSVYMFMDISSINPIFKSFPLMQNGVVNNDILNFAKNIIIPSNLNDTILEWYTYEEPPETYKVTLTSSDPTILGVTTNYNESGTVPTQNEQFIISFTCHGKNNVLKGTQIHLKLQLYDKNGNELSGLNVSPKKACSGYCILYYII